MSEADREAERQDGMPDLTQMGGQVPLAALMGLKAELEAQATPQPLPLYANDITATVAGDGLRVITFSHGMSAESPKMPIARIVIPESLYREWGLSVAQGVMEARQRQQRPPQG